MPLTKEIPPKGDEKKIEEIEGNLEIQEDLNGQEKVIEEAKRILNNPRLEEENQEKAQKDNEKKKSLREKIMGLFKAKKFSEINDPEKLREMLKEDLLDLSHIASYSTGVGGASIESGANYKNMVEKYEMGKEGEELAETIVALKKQIGKTEDAVALQTQLNEQHRIFLTKMREKGEKRISELN